LVWSILEAERLPQLLSLQLQRRLSVEACIERIPLSPVTLLLLLLLLVTMHLLVYRLADYQFVTAKWLFLDSQTERDKYTARLLSKRCIVRYASGSRPTLLVIGGFKGGMPPLPKNLAQEVPGEVIWCR